MEMNLEKRLEEAKQTYKEMEDIKTDPKIKEWYLSKQYNRIRKIEQMMMHNVGSVNSATSAILTQF
jgi:hypothetical protein